MVFFLHCPLTNHAGHVGLQQHIPYDYVKHTSFRTNS
jgi:hypothetical protein